MVATPKIRTSHSSRLQSRRSWARIFLLSFRSTRATEQGFTLLELMIVMVVIGLLAAIAIPAYTSNIRNAKEAVLKEDLHTLRQAIDSYTVDKAKAPQSLDDLVQAGYIKSMPVDPFTHRSDTWLPVQDDTLSSIDQTDSGIAAGQSRAEHCLYPIYLRHDQRLQRGRLEP